MRPLVEDEARSVQRSAVLTCLIAARPDVDVPAGLACPGPGYFVAPIWASGEARTAIAWHGWSPIWQILSGLLRCQGSFQLCDVVAGFIATMDDHAHGAQHDDERAQEVQRGVVLGLSSGCEGWLGSAPEGLGRGWYLARAAILTRLWSNTPLWFRSRLLTAVARWGGHPLVADLHSTR